MCVRPVLRVQAAVEARLQSLSRGEAADDGAVAALRDAVAVCARDVNPSPQPTTEEHD